MDAKILLMAWVLKVMFALEPNAPWKDTYGDSAEWIAEVSLYSPLFQGEDGPRKTASEFLSIGWFESHFKPNAEGDHECLKWETRATTVLIEVDGKRVPMVEPHEVCVQKGAPHSFCMFQISDGNFPWLHTTREKIQGSMLECVRAAHVMIKQSHNVCRGRVKEDRLNWYARGGEGCAENAKGKHRVLKSGWIFGHYPAVTELE